MPPNKLVLDRVEAMPAALRTLRRLPFVKEASEALGVHLGPTPQRYYPQVGGWRAEGGWRGGLVGVHR